MMPQKRYIQTNNKRGVGRQKGIKIKFLKKVINGYIGINHKKGWWGKNPGTKLRGQQNQREAGNNKVTTATCSRFVAPSKAIGMK